MSRSIEISYLLFHIQSNAEPTSYIGKIRKIVIVTHHSDAAENFYLFFRFTILQCSDDDALQLIDERFLLEGKQNDMKIFSQSI